MGVGFEYGFTPNWSLGVEYDHLWMGHANNSFSVVDPRLAPRTIILDPELTVETPAWLWTATGMRAMDHAVEVIYSSRHQLIADTLGARAISLLVNHLPASLKTTGAESLAHRGQCQLAAR